MTLFLIEFYVKSPEGISGWEIRFAWVSAETKTQAITKLRSHPQAFHHFDEVITIEEQAAIFPLALSVGTPQPLVIE